MGLFAGAAVAALLAFPGVASANVTSTVNAAGALTVTTDAGDAVAITERRNGALKINGQNPGSGAATAASITSIQVTGDGGDNNIDLSGVSDPAFGVQTSVTVDGGGGNDTITGSKLADVLKGGDGNDRIIGDDNPLARRTTCAARPATTRWCGTAATTTTSTRVAPTTTRRRSTGRPRASSSRSSPPRSVPGGVRVRARAAGRDAALAIVQDRDQRTTPSGST